MQYKVPQNVQKEDRIVGFLTFKQLIIVIIGGTIAYGIYAVLERQGIPTLIWAVPVAIILLFTAAFAFLKIANLPFHAYLALLIERLLVPSKRVWIKGADRVVGEDNYESPEEMKAKKEKEEKRTTIAHKESQIEKIGSMSSVVDSYSKKKKDAEKKTEDIDNTEDENLLQKAFLDEKPRKRKRKRKKKKTATDKIIELSAQGARQEKKEDEREGREGTSEPTKKKAKQNQSEGKQKPPAEKNAVSPSQGDGSSEPTPSQEAKSSKTQEEAPKEKRPQSIPDISFDDKKPESDIKAQAESSPSQGAGDSQSSPSQGAGGSNTQDEGQKERSPETPPKKKRRRRRRKKKTTDQQAQSEQQQAKTPQSSPPQGTRDSQNSPSQEDRGSQKTPSQKAEDSQTIPPQELPISAPSPIPVALKPEESGEKKPQIQAEPIPKKPDEDSIPQKPTSENILPAQQSGELAEGQEIRFP